MNSLRQLSAIYLMAASAFTVSIVFAHNPDWARAANAAAIYARDRGGDAAVALNEHVVKPGWAATRAEAVVLGEQIALAMKPAPAKIAEQKPARPAPHVLPPSFAAVTGPKPVHPQSHVTLDLAPQVKTPLPQTNATPPAQSPAEIARVEQRLKDSLTSEMFDHFDLFLYVSKADKGPWAQHMYVFQKTGRDLALLYNWQVSTGREKVELDLAGDKTPSITPQGYYELDPHRFYVHYRSMQWGQAMPHAMFFQWEKDGYETGLAIHGATGDDVSLLGTRSSAGCIRIAPENAALLQSLIRAKYKGLVPQFAYDKKTATISNDGVMVHDTDGRLQLAQGYRVLVFIENYGGENVVAALF